MEEAKEKSSLQEKPNEVKQTEAPNYSEEDRTYFAACHAVASSPPTRTASGARFAEKRQL